MQFLIIALGFGTLVGLVVPRIVGSSCESCISPVKSDLSRISALLDHFQLDCSRYPTTREGLAALTAPPPGLEAKWRGPYAKRVGDDPWGHPYRYESRGKDYTLTSLGADGKLGGEGMDVDEQG